MYIVDLDSERRTQLARLLRQRGLTTEAFRNGDDLLAACSYLRPGCVLIVGGWPEERAVDLLVRLRAARPEMVCVLMDAHPSIPEVVRALQSGASDFIDLPYDENGLIASLRRAASLLPDRIERHTRAETSRRLVEALTPRERQVMHMVARGATSRVIAVDLKISVRTVELHRANVMQKLGVHNIAALARISILLDYLGNDER